MFCSVSIHINSGLVVKWLLVVINKMENEATDKKSGHKKLTNFKIESAVSNALVVTSGQQWPHSQVSARRVVFPGQVNCKIGQKSAGLHDDFRQIVQLSFPVADY